MAKYDYINRVRSNSWLQRNWILLLVIFGFILFWPIIRGLMKKFKLLSSGQTEAEHNTEQEFLAAYNQIASQFSPSQAQFPTIHKQRAEQIYKRLSSPYSTGQDNLYVRDRFKRPGYENIDFNNWNRPENIKKLQSLGITNNNYQQEWHRVYLDKHDILGIYKEFGLRKYSYFNGGEPTWLDSITDLFDITDSQNIDLWEWITQKFSPQLKHELKTAFNKKQVYI